jgi:hypothetical protein
MKSNSIRLKFSRTSSTNRPKTNLKFSKSPASLTKRITKMPTEITTVNFEQHLRLHIDICILVMADENDELTQQHQELIIRIITEHLTEEDFLTSEQDQIKATNFITNYLNDFQQFIQITRGLPENIREE